MLSASGGGSQARLDRRRNTLYFAYGSNLHFGQMARRCPGSRFVGRARLHGYRWQINQRGYANVVVAAGSVVDGLVFELGSDDGSNSTDEARLDRSEGVAMGAYAKEYFSVHVWLAPSPLYRRRVVSFVDHGGPGEVLRGSSRHAAEYLPEQGPLIEPDVLVYLSRDFVDDGLPLDEYIGRINKGVRDALAVGVDPKFIDRAIRPLIPAEGTGAGDGGSAQAGGEARPGGARARARMIGIPARPRTASPRQQTQRPPAPAGGGGGSGNGRRRRHRTASDLPETRGSTVVGTDDTAVPVGSRRLVHVHSTRGRGPRTYAYGSTTSTTTTTTATTATGSSTARNSNTEPASYFWAGGPRLCHIL